MALVTTSVRTYGFGAFTADEMLRMAFYPSGAGLTTFSTFPQRPVWVEPDADGLVRAELVPTYGLRPDVWYTVRFEWFYTDPATGQRLPGWSEIKGRLRVPEAGGTLGDLLETAAPPGSVMWGYGPPPSYLQDVIYADFSGMKLRFYGPTNGGIQ